MNKLRPLSDETLYASPDRLHEYALSCRPRALTYTPKSPRRARQAYLQTLKTCLAQSKPVQVEQTVANTSQDPDVNEPARLRASLRRADKKATAQRPEPVDWLEHGSHWLSVLTATIGLLLLALLLIFAWVPMAQATEQGAYGLQLQHKATGSKLSALELGTEVQMHVSGLLARVQVTQSYRNPSEQWQEGLYLFPLPERAAVDHMRIHIGERVIEGQIQEKQQARATYEQAKAAGQRTGLVQQKRANMFTAEVANIGPGETVRIEIEYQQTLSYQDAVFELRFPMVVGPRYNAQPQNVEHFDSAGWASAQAIKPIADEAVPAVPYQQHSAQRLNLSIDLDAGMALDKIESPYHAIISTPLEHSTGTDHGRYRITLAEGAVAVNRDFVLRWQPAASARPQAALFTQQLADAAYALLLFVPPDQALSERDVIAREVIYVIDTSGSMHGPSIIQAREALDLALSQLRTQDRFNVIQFNSNTEQLFPQAVTASPANVRKARDYVATLNADGGTEMAAALRAALSTNREATQAIRQVVFLTDGSVDNEQALFAMIRSDLGDSRLFTVGIGSAPNSHFMREAARFGRGSFTYIGDSAEVADKMSALFRKLQSPVLQDIRVDWPADANVDMQPDKIPDLYAGEPLLLQAKLAHLQGKVRLSAQGSAQAWSIELPLDRGAPRNGIEVAWARAKLAALEDSLANDGDGQVQQHMTQLALKHHLVSRFTSLVAVDVTPARAPEAALESGQLPLAMPAGWDAQKVFGHALPQTATPAPLHLLLGLLALGGGVFMRRWGRLA